MSVLAAVRKGDALAPGGSPTPMDQITIKTPNPKGRLFLQIYLKRDLTAVLYLSEALYPTTGVVSNFVGSESCQIHSV
jgi:hypothetical protein